VAASAETPREAAIFIVVCAGRPIDDTGSADLSYVAHALDQRPRRSRREPRASFRSNPTCRTAGGLAERRGGARTFFVASGVPEPGKPRWRTSAAVAMVIGTFGTPDPAALAMSHPCTLASRCVPLLTIEGRRS